MRSLPAAFMSAVSLTYILVAKEGFRLPDTLARVLGGAFAAVLFCVYLFFLSRSDRLRRALPAEGSSEK